MTTRVLVVDDDPAVRSAVARALRVDYDVGEAADGADALAQHAASPADAIVLDLLMPEIGGLDVCRSLRRRGDPVPVLVVTARDAVDDRVEGLDAGADDYLVKPFAYEELAARLRALARRGAGARRPEPKLVVGPITLDETARRVTLDGKTVDLSPREFSLLECLLRHPGQTLSRDQLLDQAWPFSVAVTPNAVDAYIHYLREKLGVAGRLIE
ncbi:MAG TPA: response regulator transcription factor, partial [Gaiellaceae bacterium]|nr:response regulator transcription factor [Gaiellaceae bacterium]